MSEIKFLGNGSGFSETHTNAFFIQNNDLILIDCSLTNKYKIDELVNNNLDKNIYIILTHLHADHCSYIGLLSQYLFYVKKIKAKILIPRILINDLTSLLKIQGVSNECYSIYCLEDNKFKWFLNIIKTTHAIELDGKCFGYEFYINNKQCIYSGDTCCLNDFLKNIKNNNEIYLDVSFSYGGVHLKFSEIENELINLTKKNCKVFLMHIDDEVNLRTLLKNKKYNNIEIVSIN